MAPRKVLDLVLFRWRDLTHISQHGPEFSPDKTWTELSKNIREIQNHNASNLSFEENHRFAYNMVLYKHGDMLYKGVRNLVKENLDTLARDKILPAFPTGTTDVSVQNNEEEVLLKALTDVWDDHRSNMVRLGQILKYMVSITSWMLYDWFYFQL